MKYRVAMHYALAALCGGFFLLFLLLPVFNTVSAGCRWGLIAEIFRNRVYLDGLLNSLGIAFTTTVMVFGVSLGLALLYDRFDYPLRNWCGFFMLLPMILPPFVGALGFQQLLGHYGIVNSILHACGLARVDFLGGNGRFWSVCFIEALHLYPIFYLNLIGCLANIDPALEEAAANFGASRWRRFTQVTLPMLKPGMLAGGSIVLAWSFTELGTPLMFGYTRTSAVQILNGLMELETNPVPYALVVVMLIFSAAMYLVARGALGGSRSNVGKGMTSRTLCQPRRVLRYLITGAFLLVTFLAVTPHLSLILLSLCRNYYQTVLPEHFTLDNYTEALSNALVLPSVLNSLRYSTLAMLIALLCGIVVALANCRWKLRGAGILDMLAMLPLAIPGVVVAFGFLSMSVKYQWAEKWFDPVRNPLLLLAIAYAVRRIPYVVRSVTAGLEQTPEELEQAASNFGATPGKVFRQILLPLVFGNLVVGGLFAFSFSMLEVSDSLVLAQKSAFFPITRALYELAQILGAGSSVAAAFGVWSMLFLATTLAIAGVILGRKLSSVFRF